MFLIKRQLCKNLSSIRNQSSVAAALIEQKAVKSETTGGNGDSEYTDKPQYPEILDLSYEARRGRKKQLWYDAIKNIKTVEEKLLKLNVPRYYGYNTISLKGHEFPYNCLPLTQHYTRTLLHEIEQLPSDYYGKNSTNVDSFTDCLKSSVQDIIEFSVDVFRRKYSDKNLKPIEYDQMLGEMLVKQINRIVLTSLMADCNHLNEIEIDYNPRHEAFWFVGGIDPSKAAKKSRKGLEWTSKYADDPYDRPVQYTGKPYLALRHKFPLEPIYSVNDPINSEDKTKIPIHKYDPRVIGYGKEYRHGTTIPGYWPGNPNEFGLLSYQKRNHLLGRNPNFGDEDFKEAIHSQGIQSSYAWLYAQACYQGFSTYHDITYPLLTQTVITNGQIFSFYVYQLNTTLVYDQNVYNNPKVNYCWGTKEMKLYESIDENGKCIGFNENVLKTLIHFYINEPKQRSKDLNLKPYLNNKEQKISDIENDERRIFLEKEYKHMTSNRPRHLPIPEIYAWERIYKINNKTRNMEPKRRFFELGINPYKRTMDDHTPDYIPKVLRPEGPKSKKKWKKMYYP